jgi:hypothetical protein
MKHWFMFLVLGCYGLRILQAIYCGCLDDVTSLMYGADWISLFILGSWRLNSTLNLHTFNLYRKG